MNTRAKACLAARGAARCAVILPLIFPLIGAARAETQATPDSMVDAIEKITGVHKGLRRNHGKGFCGAGVFRANAEGAKLSASPLFSQVDIPALFRFSIAGPNPNAGDAAVGPRGLALQFTLPGGALHDIVMINVPIFPSATVQGFYDLQLANAADPATGKPEPDKMKAYVASHPDFLPFVEWLKAHRPPPSYADAAYYGIHAFKFIDASGAWHWVKFRFEPRDGVKSLSEQDMAAAPHDFLEQKLDERLRDGPAVFDMIVTLGENGDTIDNATKLWPAERREVKVGALTLTKAGGDACNDVMFDPNLLSAGVEASPDPILAFRSSAYAVSFGRRIEEKAK